MNRIEFFVCKRCGIRTTKSPLYKNGMCDSCNNKFHAKQFKNELNKLPSEIASKYCLYIMNVDIHDYRKTIICENYVLIKVDEEVREVISNMLELVQLDIREEVRDCAKYLFATDVSLDIERIECHLHNLFNSESCEFSRSFICGLDLTYLDWSFRHKISEHILNISIEGIDEMLELRSDSTKDLGLNEIDAKYIFNKLSESVGDSLFRGINKHYFHNDGIAASIYRNNSDLFKYGMLQEHEREVVSTLLSKTFYQPNTERKLIYALTDLRHSGKDTCLLDFSNNLKIVLFFCCYPIQTDTVGEILILSKEEFEFKDEVTYPNENDFLIKPAITMDTGNRVEAQDSVFLYCHQGYFPRNKSGSKVRNLLITPRLKSIFYSYCGYSEEEIYPDFHGFIENPENFNTTAKLECKKKENDEKVDKKFV